MKRIIGRLEKIDFLDFEIHDINAKIDTGAYTSSIRCLFAEEDKENGVLRFKLLHPKFYPQYANRIYETKEYRKKKVKSTLGIAEYRFVIKTHVLFCNKKYYTEFTLAKREGLKNPVLIGRKFLNKKFLVDTQLTYTNENSNTI